MKRWLRRFNPLVERLVAGTPLVELGIRQFLVGNRPSESSQLAIQPDTPANESRSWSRVWRLLGPLLLLVMLWRIGPDKCWAAIRAADPLWFLVACALSLPALGIKAIRWQTFVRSLGHKLAFGQSIRDYATGSLAAAVTPGRVGDLAKAPMLAARGVPLGAGIAASLLDRVCDAVVLFAAGLASILALPALPGRGAIALGATFALLLTLGAVVVFRAPFFNAIRFTSTAWWLTIAVTTIAALVSYYASAYACAKSLALDLAVVDVVAGASVAAVLALLPITVAGIGTRDAAFIVIFAQRSIDAEHAVALSSLILAWMLVNCVLFLVVSRLHLSSIEKPHVLSENLGVISHDPRD